MLFSVDAHTIGCHLTGNEVYIRNLLNEYAELDQTSEFITYLAKPRADLSVPLQIHGSAGFPIIPSAGSATTSR